MALRRQVEAWQRRHVVSMEQVEVRKRGRVSPEIDSPEVKWLREDLLDGLDEDPDFCTSSQDLDSFMKSFENEISAYVSPAAAGGVSENRVVDLATDSGDSRPDLGYLLEASDDELGIPPPTASPARTGDELKTDLVTVDSDSAEFWEVSDYDPFDRAGRWNGQSTSWCRGCNSTGGLDFRFDSGLDCEVSGFWLRFLDLWLMV